MSGHRNFWTNDWEKSATVLSFGDSLSVAKYINNPCEKLPFLQTHFNSRSVWVALEKCSNVTAINIILATINFIVSYEIMILTEQTMAFGQQKANDNGQSESQTC